MSEEGAIIRKYQTKGILWYLTVLGSLATTQREYVALHGFQNLQQQVNDCILVTISTQVPVYHCLKPNLVLFADG
jgi:senataxin